MAPNSADQDAHGVNVFWCNQRLARGFGAHIRWI
jgi:hypothetical protein